MATAKAAAATPPKKSFKMPKVPVWAWVLVIGAVVGGYVYSVKQDRPVGGWRYGVCKVFLDLYVRYPESLRVNDVLEGPTSARIGYSSANTFGSMEVHDMECTYSREDNGQVRMSGVVLDPGSKYLRKRIDDERVKSFSNSVFGRSNWIISQEMDLTLPKPLPARLLTEKDLMELKLE